jgi:hypothetical protein
MQACFAPFLFNGGGLLRAGAKKRGKIVDQKLTRPV